MIVGSVVPFTVGPFLLSDGTPLTSGTPSVTFRVNGTLTTPNGSFTDVATDGCSIYTPGAGDPALATAGELTIQGTVGASVTWSRAYDVVASDLSSILDGASTTPPSAGPASGWTFRQRLLMLCRLVQSPAAENGDTRTLFADDGTTVITTQSVADDGVTQSQGSQ